MAVSNNLLGGFGAGFNAGNAITQNMIDTRKQNEFARLASQSYSAQPDQQQELLGQMAAINPAGAQAQQGQFQQQDDRRKAQLVNASRYMMSAFKSGDQAAIQGAYKTMLPAFQQLDPTLQLPEAADDSMLPILHQILATADGGVNGANVQSTYVDGDGNRVAIMRDGTTQTLGKNDAGATQQTITIDGPDGRPAQYTFDRRTGGYIPAGAGMGGQQAQSYSAPQQPQGQPQQFTGSDGAPVSIGADVPPHIAAQIRAAEVGGGGVPDQFNAAPASAPQSQPSQFVGRRKEDEAAAVAAAQQQVNMSYLPQELAMRTQAELAKASGTGAITRSNEQATLDATRARDANKTLSLLSDAEKLLPGATGSRAGAIADDAAAFIGRSTPGAQKTAALLSIAGQLTSSMPRMQGPQSDKDVQLYREMAGDLANDNLPVPTRVAALNQIRALNQKYAGGESLDHIPRLSQSTSQPQRAVQRARNPQTGEMLELRNGQWVPAQ